MDLTIDGNSILWLEDNQEWTMIILFLHFKGMMFFKLLLGVPLVLCILQGKGMYTVDQMMAEFSYMIYLQVMRLFDFQTDKQVAHLETSPGIRDTQF